jgi:hypothetical protein
MLNISRKQMNPRFLRENLNERDYMGDQGIDDRIILKSILGKSL